MNTPRLRAGLTRALMVALAAPVGACCNVTEEQSTFSEGGYGFPRGSTTVTCEEVCTAGPRCPDGTQFARCTMSGDVGARTATCVFERSDCPKRPGAWGSCGRLHHAATRAPVADCKDPVGRLFASMAALEAEAVPAFECLAAELTAHRAPRSLVRDARAAVEDERRHARAMRSLARAHGADAPAVSAPSTAPRSRYEIALENAVEGCVRETFGALLAMWQSERASDRRVRMVMRAIADDELRHAALGWRVDAWAREGLTEDQRTRVDDAMRDAVRAMRDAFDDPAPAARERAGYPTRAEALRLIDACERHVWQGAS